MKKITCIGIICFAVILFFNSLKQTQAIPTTETTYYWVVLVKSGGIYQTGQTPYLGIMRMSDGAWYDFSSSTFKLSGWGTQNIAVDENTTNIVQKHYGYRWTKPTGEAENEEYIGFACTQTGIRMCDAKVICFERVRFITGP